MLASTSFSPTLRYIPVTWTADAVTFRLEVQVSEGGKADWTRWCKREYTRNGKKWVLNVAHFLQDSYTLDVLVPETVGSRSFRPYQRTDGGDIQYKKSHRYRQGVRAWLRRGGLSAAFFIGVECVLAGETLTYATQWNFISSEHIKNWNVILRVGEMKFYAHKKGLSFVSSKFETMFNGDSKNHEEVPVNVDGTHAEHFEAFLQCIYPNGAKPRAEFIVELITLADYFGAQQLLEKCVRILPGLPHVSNVEKLRVALKLNSEALQEAVVASLTTFQDVGIVLHELKGHLDDALQKKLYTKANDLMAKKRRPLAAPEDASDRIAMVSGLETEADSD